MQHEYRVSVAGPTTLAALLTAFQQGFRTLAIQKRSAEVWRTLGAVKTEFGKFGEQLDKTRKHLDAASKSIDAAEVRTRAMTRELKLVEALPETEAVKLLGGSNGAERDGESG